MGESLDFKADLDAIAGIPAVATILDVVCTTTGMGFAAVARVTEERWIACGVHDTIRFGLKPGDELRIETTICDAIRQNNQAVVIDNVAEDPCYSGHATPLLYGFKSYISVPIVMPDGSIFGTLCAIDPQPARVNTPQIIGMFNKFAALIAFQLDADRKAKLDVANLLDARRTSELREQFIAVLGHDLRNPLAGISGGIDMMARTPLNDRAQRLVPMIRSSVRRMAGLIDNVLDFARGRLGDGLTLTQEPCDLAAVVAHVVEEMRSGQPDRGIELETDLKAPVLCDRSRIAQLLSNLLANALTHGAADGPVRVRAVADKGQLELSVSNSGEPISPAALVRLFEPFERGAGKPSQHGLGLGLYIASQIAAAHGGTLRATSSETETRFTFAMPLPEPVAHPGVDGPFMASVEEPISCG